MKGNNENGGGGRETRPISHVLKHSFLSREAAARGHMAPVNDGTEIQHECNALLDPSYVIIYTVLEYYGQLEDIFIAAPFPFTKTIAVNNFGLLLSIKS